MDNYDKIKTVGKGAFGTAVLYKKLSTNQLVVLKEINIHDLTPAERAMALNEVQVLSSLQHKNIIGYGGSFEYNGTLMIEMDYADGGTLSQMLSRRKSNLPERQVLSLLDQICAAIVYMHSQNILHRDLKAANVFLDSEGCVKIGDFGISKILTTNAQAQTVLGTPYYISPELCEGKDYDEKSDIWAMGCTLYEMCCLQRTFQASSLPALVNKIMKGDFKPIPAGYSVQLSILVDDLLQKLPERRPTAKAVQEERIPHILSALGDGGYQYMEPNPLMGIQPRRSFSFNENKNSLLKGKVDRSVLYQVKSFQNDISVFPICLPAMAKIVHVSTGYNHFIVVTDEFLVYTWGEGNKGQLGHGDKERWRHFPSLVQDLTDKNIVRAEVGQGFSIFLTKEGNIMSCGSGAVGSLGHGNWNDHERPKIIDSLIGVEIMTISCGSGHVVALSKENHVYTWGRGDKGQTGQKSTLNSCFPTRISLPETNPIAVYCGGEASMILSANGKLYACGWNLGNKLAVVDRRKSFKKRPTWSNDSIIEFVEVIGIPGRILDCSIGQVHCAVKVGLSDGSAAVYTTGCPPDLMAVLPNVSTHFDPVQVTELDGLKIEIIKCGPTYTVVATDDNCILMWGARYGLPEAKTLLTDSKESSGVWSQQSSNAKQLEGLQGSSTSIFTNFLAATYVPEVIKKPISLLALYSSPQQINKGSYLVLKGIYPLTHSILVLIQTTVPLRSSVSTNNEENTDSDTIGPLPQWMKSEIAKSKHQWVGEDSSFKR